MIVGGLSAQATAAVLDVGTGPLMLMATTFACTAAGLIAALLARRMSR